MLTSLAELTSVVRDRMGEALYRVQERIFGGSNEALPDRSRRRWIAANPDNGLTWGRQVTGAAFVSKVTAHCQPDSSSRVLEIGPGYGRLLNAWLKTGIPFSNYLAVDISATNVQWLSAKFEDPRVHFLNADAETASFDGMTFDIVLSSLVFKHLFPSFASVLRNVSKYLSPGAMIFFDLREGSTRMFDPRDNVTFVRWYTKDETLEILADAGLSLVSFDTVEHDAEHHRLLVIALKP